MDRDHIDSLAEAIYDAAIDPESWRDVMALVREGFDTSVEALYALDYDGRSMRPIQLSGIPQRFVASFEASFFTEDNPSTRTAALHRPGLIRTDQWLGEQFRDADVLKRSRYYREWLEPQGLAHTMGMTPLAEDGMVVNLSILRTPQAGPFAPRDVARFERMHAHVCRALRVAVRLERLTAGAAASAAALDGLTHGVIFLNDRDQVLHCNATAEAWIGRGNGLTLRAGRLVLADPAAQQRLAAVLRTLHGRGSARGVPQGLLIRRPDRDRPLTLSAVRLSAQRSRFVATLPTVMLLIVDPDAPPRPGAGLLRRLYRLTPAEARLAQALIGGGGLRQAAATAGMSYETARWYLKVLFQKTHTSRQAELVARLLADLGGLAIRRDD